MRSDAPRTWLGNWPAWAMVLSLLSAPWVPAEEAAAVPAATAPAALAPTPAATPTAPALTVADMVAAGGPVAADAQLPVRVGDSVSILMSEDAEIRFEGRIGESGVVRIPLLGDVRVAGLTARQVQDQITAALEKDYYQKATVSVQLLARSPGTVFLYGAVKTHGAVELPTGSNLTLLQVISKGGGITAWADARNCRITRVDRLTQARTVLTVNLETAFQDIGGKDDILLQSGDIIFIPAANAQANQVLTTEPCEVIVVGEVASPGIISFAPGESRTIMRAVFKAGNFSRFAKSKEVRLIRYAAGERTVLLVDVAAILEQGLLDKDVELKPGDMVIVDQKMFSFQ